MHDSLPTPRLISTMSQAQGSTPNPCPPRNKNRVAITMIRSVGKHVFDHRAIHSTTGGSRYHF